MIPPALETAPHHPDPALECGYTDCSREGIKSPVSTVTDIVSPRSNVSWSEGEASELSHETSFIYMDYRVLTVLHTLKYLIVAVVCAACIALEGKDFDGHRYKHSAQEHNILLFGRVADAFASEMFYKVAQRSSVGLGAVEAETDTAIYAARGWLTHDTDWLVDVRGKDTYSSDAKTRAALEGVGRALHTLSGHMWAQVLPMAAGRRGRDYYHLINGLTSNTVVEARFTPMLGRPYDAKVSAHAVASGIKMLDLMDDPAITEAGAVLAQREVNRREDSGVQNRSATMEGVSFALLADRFSDLSNYERHEVEAAIYAYDRERQQRLAAWIAMCVVLIVSCVFVILEVHEMHQIEAYERHLFNRFQNTDETARLITTYQGQIETCRKLDGSDRSAMKTQAGMEQNFSQCLEALTNVHPFIPAWVFIGGGSCKVYAQGNLVENSLDALCNVVIGADGSRGSMTPKPQRSNSAPTAHILRRFKDKVAARRRAASAASRATSVASHVSGRQSDAGTQRDTDSAPSRVPSGTTVDMLNSDTSSAGAGSRKSSTCSVSSSVRSSKSVHSMLNFYNDLQEHDQARQNVLNLQQNSLKRAMFTCSVLLLDIRSFDALSCPRVGVPVAEAQRVINGFLAALVHEVRGRGGGSIAEVTPISILVCYDKVAGAVGGALRMEELMREVADRAAPTGGELPSLKVPVALSNGRFVCGQISTGITKMFMFAGRQRAVLEELGCVNRRLGISFATGAGTIRHLLPMRTVAYRPCAVVERHGLQKGEEAGVALVYEVTPVEPKEDNRPDDSPHNKLRKKMRDELDTVMKTAARDPALGYQMLQDYFKTYDGNGDVASTYPPARTKQTEFLHDVLQSAASRRDDQSHVL